MAYAKTKRTQALRPTRDVTINIRAKRRQRDLIDQAAAAMGKNRSDFILETACRKAQNVLLDQTVFHLDGQAFQRFIALLDAPPVSHARLRALLTAPAPWDK